MSTQVVVPADVVAVAIAALGDAFADRDDDVKVTDRVPADAERFIIPKLVDTLAPRARVIFTSIVRFDVFAPTKEDAHDLAQLARGLLAALRGAVVDGVTIYGIDDTQAPEGVKDEPDPLTNEPGFTFHSAISTRGTPQ